MEKFIQYLSRFILGLAFFTESLYIQLLNVVVFLQENEKEIIAHTNLFYDSFKIGLNNIYNLGECSRISYSKTIEPKVNKQLVEFGLKIPR